MKVCVGCGSLAPEPELPCGACGRRGVVDAPEARPDRYFVAVRCQFQCRGCGRLAPLDEVDVDGLVRCALCGLTQAFSADVWRPGAGFAQAVGDLAGGEGLHPHPRYAIGATNPYADVGRGRATATTTVSGRGVEEGLEIRRSLRIVASPGHPVCDQCTEPLRVELPGRGRATTTCPSCGARRDYAVPGDVLAIAPGLLAALADGHRSDVREAKAASGGAGAIVGLNCPGCGGPLPVEGHSRTVTCRFCQLVSRIPGEFEVHASEAPPTAFWLVFSGPSEARRALEHEPGAGGDGARAVRRLAADDYEPVGFFAGRAVPATVALGVTGAVGVVLFLLMRAGVLAL